MDDRKLKYFDFTVNQKDPIWEVELPGGVESLQLAGDGLCVLGASDGRVFVVSQEKRALVAEAKVFGDAQPVTALAVSANASGADGAGSNWLVACGSPEANQLRILSLDAAGNLQPVGERNMDAGAFSLAFGQGTSACMVFAGLGNSQVRAINAARIVGREVAERAFGYGFDDMARLADLSANLEGPNDAAEADADDDRDDRDDRDE